MILLDSNVFMYAAGGPHPSKRPSAELLMLIAEGKLDALIDAEVLQEILHRYRAIGRWKEGSLVYDHARAIVPIVVAITDEIMDVARQLLDTYPSLMARDAVHAAACMQAGARAICSFDSDFDCIAGLVRHEPGHYLRRARK